LLAVSDKLRDLRRASSHELSKPDKDENNELRRRCDDDDDDVVVTMTLSSDRQQQLMLKCVKLLTQKHFLDVASNSQVHATVYTARRND